ncbi:MAG: cytochrome (ubi)quinol oxidase subunit III [Sulfobacillus benefaciens]|uniref:Cytochrome (Ubi)quinol oxidase subunit III n=1 Tax=Sulfobacillus benefaciens TaxID=453960 RepID=A0A2T2XCW0_9FIRM|nr:MAG: cytochrome (ubi)quinol oxidase subunit III [Sulfobacillus benefaciens]
MADMPIHGHSQIDSRVSAEFQAPIDNGVLGMWIWLSGEGVFFASLIGAYIMLHNNLNNGPGVKILDLPSAVISTVIILLSSMTMMFSLGQIQKGKLIETRLWLTVTGALGLAFVLLALNEYSALYHQGFTLHTSPFSSAFYALTGFDAAHVAFGVLWALGLLVYTFHRNFLNESILKLKVLSLYWGFVTIIWMVVFTVVYLLGKVA